MNADRFDVFEQMHWLCFHLEFEHQGDPDTFCGDPDCPWWQIEVYKQRLLQLNISLDDVLSDAIKKRWNL